MKPTLFNKPYLLIEACVHLTLWVLYFSLSQNLDFYITTLEQTTVSPPQPASTSLFVLLTFYWCYFAVPFCKKNAGFYGAIAAYLAALCILTTVDCIYSVGRTIDRISISRDYLPFLFKHTMWSLLSVAIKRFLRNLKRAELAKEQNLALAHLELAALKQQVSPHFMFNVLNSLYSTSYMFGDTRTSQGIEQLSSLLRYMLYESNSQKVLLRNEVEYLDNYIRLQMLRFSDDVELRFEKGDINANTHIAPMLLIVLVENAFKHGVSTKDKTTISIALAVKHNVISFEISNPIANANKRTQVTTTQNGGLGLANLKRRLSLLYKDKHTLEISTKSNVFTARMTLT
ncbi:hypothetical protein BK026_18450 [Alteromonas sp. V450]|uniref:sensor histidine kinase n=1 Tax=Alteromonas sp. V450 TaxID=1912139 RepID=UPI0008FF2541|nr:histidine kinase [Alteromonas sp. V450]OJF70592.1 hypothetical protein BK026_18450 [Alteromonas sp. V450]